MKNNIFIPTKINVGFQERKDTYTQKLAYIVYYDQNNKLRKETSWNSWRDNKIDPIEFDNIPMSGFVLNKKVGGYSSGWNHRQTYTRIYDPRDFEFEITVPNLLYILENTNSIKGKGLEGEFVYGWDSKDLILIPTSSPDYQELAAFNNNIHNKNIIKAKDLIIGATYQTKNNMAYIYMGKFDCYDNQYRTYENGEYKWYKRYKDLPMVERKNNYYGYSKQYIEHEYKQTNCGKEFFFYTGDNFIHLKSISGLLISTIDDNCIDNYADLFEKLECYEYYSPIDDDKDIIVPYDLDEFMTIIKKREDKERYWGYPTFHNKDKVKFEIRYKNGKYKDNDNYRDENYNLSVEELFNKIQPVHLDKYLENNKFYKRSY